MKISTKYFCSFIFLIITFSCSKKDNIEGELYNNDSVKIEIPEDVKFTNGFDFPVGKPDAKGYYNAQPFSKNNHLGDDWNGKGGGNTDLGDNIYAIANGYVKFAENIDGGWGNVVRINHYVDENKVVESLYAHCNEIFVKEGQYVSKGMRIATIGTNNGQYLAHLHFEMREDINLPIGGGYSSNTKGYLNPTEFIKKHRKK